MQRRRGSQADQAWKNLVQPPRSGFPPATKAQVHQIASALLAKLPQLNGRDRNDVQFALSMVSDYHNLPEPVAYVLYQRLNILFLAVYKNWPTALAASRATAAVPPRAHYRGRQGQVDDLQTGGLVIGTRRGKRSFSLQRNYIYINN